MGSTGDTHCYVWRSTIFKMTWRQEKTSVGTDLVWSGGEMGIAPSPLKGTANIQNANISTEMGEIMASYARVKQTTQADISGGTLTASVSDGATLLASSASILSGYWINISSSTITRTTLTIDYLVAGGGGGGGGSTAVGRSGGAGGAGGVKFGSSSVSVAAYAITVGAGGAAGSAAGTKGVVGGDSTIGTLAITSTGGGYGGGSDTNLPGGAGGSGGGAGADSGGPNTGGAGTVGQGNNGGSTVNLGNSGGGGGGYTAAGTTATDQGGGDGGTGFTSSISGAAVTYGGGGGGGGQTLAGVGGAGGGGAGGLNSVGVAGTANTGGGGGGGNGIFGGGAGGSGVVIIRYRTGAMTATGGTITVAGSYTVHTFITNGTFTVTGNTLSGNFFVSYRDGNGKVKISDFYDPYGAHAVAHSTSGTATFSTVTTFTHQPIAKATEKYSTASTTEYRYYILDVEGYVWAYDTAVTAATLAATGVATLWMLTDPTDYSSFDFTGMNVLNGWLFVINVSSIRAKPTVSLGDTFTNLTQIHPQNPFPTHSNFAYVGHQGKLFYCDGDYLGEIFPTNSLATVVANVQSFASFSASTITGTIASLIGGSAPEALDTTTRIPAVFFVDQYGVLPTALTQAVVYYIDYTSATNKTFQVYIAASGGSALDIQTGSSGTQYYNTFYPLGSTLNTAASAVPLAVYTPQRVNFPFFEVIQCMVEVGNTIIIGGITNTLYPWNQIDATPSDLIALPESNVKTMINVNNMAYVFAGNKGNIYITNNSVASLVTKVPDYCAGVPGSPNTYIEPYFTWGDSIYLRGRVYFSILDQISTKAGNCGGVWSFVPAQNFSYGQDTGIALRLENQNSYGSYNGVATVLIASENQAAISPQYWAGWQNSYTAAVSSQFGIDFTDTIPTITTIVETDTANTGTLLTNTTYSQVEYKMATPLASGDSIQLYYRLNSTDAWATCGTVKEETADRISGYFSANFENTQWLQLRAVMTSNGLTTSSFNRLTELRVR